MKKDLYNFLNKDISFVKGVGNILGAKLANLFGGARVLDFLLHCPTNVYKRNFVNDLFCVKEGELITIELSVISHNIPENKFYLYSKKKIPIKFICQDIQKNKIEIIFYNSKFLDYFQKKMPIGGSVIISGKISTSGKQLSIVHPDFIETISSAGKIPEYQIVYPSSAGISQKSLISLRNQIFENLDTLEIDEELKDFFYYLKKIHFAENLQDLSPNSECMEKLAYFELLSNQIAINMTRKKRQSIKTIERIKKYNLLEKLYSLLPFELTEKQKNAVSDIIQDMNKNIPMSRLIQGDVGSGKTVIALIASVYNTEFNGQSVLMAPTDALALQHYEKIKPLFDKLGIVCDLLTGRDKGKKRYEKLISIKSGRTKLIIGTHSVFSTDVMYKDLSLVIVDEQHRFGVSQRQDILNKGTSCHFLSLSATPIPRTLSMTFYGDMDISIINEKPKGRLPIITTKLSITKLDNLIIKLKKQIENKEKVFWICPLVEESEIYDFTDVQTRFNYLKRYFKNIAIIHGKLDSNSKDKIITDFRDSKLDILVATSVIEVGIDVPDASIIIIENAERFGLSALHQLRGRVGRGDKQSFCILLYGKNISDNGQKRLDILCDTNDGFAIAEKDLMMRGVGSLLGTRQSGWLKYHFVDYREHHNIFKKAIEDSKQVKEVSQSDRDLMFLFGNNLGFGL